MLDLPEIEAVSGGNGDPTMTLPTVTVTPPSGGGSSYDPYMWGSTSNYGMDYPQNDHLILAQGDSMTSGTPNHMTENGAMYVTEFENGQALNGWTQEDGWFDTDGDGVHDPGELAMEEYKNANYGEGAVLDAYQAWADHNGVPADGSTANDFYESYTPFPDNPGMV
ncbi:penta-EF hand family protein [Henriciella aquimarina]|uniref:hypothetical protein n=1 Tax=Henriciella aquimarina TaxID=545261 RepID=UPI0011799762|nr:hypothetical protein [Henriciella aquimarina]